MSWVNIGVDDDGYVISMSLTKYKMKFECDGETYYVKKPNGNGWLMATKDVDQACVFENSDDSKGGYTISVVGDWDHPENPACNGYDSGNWYVGTDYHQGLGCFLWRSAGVWEKGHVGKLTSAGCNGRMATYGLVLYKGNSSFYACGSGGGYHSGHWSLEPLIQLPHVGLVGRPQDCDNTSPFLKAALGFIQGHILNAIGSVPGGATIAKICDFSREEDLSLQELGEIIMTAPQEEAKNALKAWATKKGKKAWAERRT